MRGITSTAFITLKEFLDLVLVKEERWERGEESKANGKRRHAHLIHWEAPQWHHPPQLLCEWEWKRKREKTKNERRKEEMRKTWCSLHRSVSLLTWQRCHRILSQCDFLQIHKMSNGRGDLSKITLRMWWEGEEERRKEEKPSTKFTSPLSLLPLFFSALPHLSDIEMCERCHVKDNRRDGCEGIALPYSPKMKQFKDERSEKKMRNKWHSLSNTSWSEGMSHKTSGNTSKWLYDKVMTCSLSCHPPSTPHTRWINKKEDTRRSKKNEEKKKK